MVMLERESGPIQFVRAHLCAERAMAYGISDQAIKIVEHSFAQPISPDPASPNWQATLYAYRAQQEALLSASRADKHPILSDICPLHPPAVDQSGHIEPPAHGSLVVTLPQGATVEQCVEVFHEAFADLSFQKTYIESLRISEEERPFDFSLVKQYMEKAEVFICRLYQ